MPTLTTVSDAAEFDERPRACGLVDATREDEYWRRAFGSERYYRQGMDYEDYAPAYCVGYIGYAQYGGEYRDAETSLCANWERIKGASRLSLDAARDAMRAAWDRVAQREALNVAHLARPTQLPAGPAMHAAPG